MGGEWKGLLVLFMLKDEVKIGDLCKDKYVMMICKVVKKYGVFVKIVKVVVEVESNFNLKVCGVVGEVGLM